MRHLRLSIIAAVVLVFWGCRDCFAGIRPSFLLDHCAWHASDIIVATQGAESDGKLTVLEKWKGSSKAGETITIPELAGYKPEVSNPLGPDKEPPIKAVTGQRMILFVVRGTKVSETASQIEITWSSASIYKEMNVSMVWVEKGQVYNFCQVLNPGPSLLISLGRTEEQFKKDVEAVLADQAKLQKAMVIKDPSERARCLKPMAAGRYAELRQAAFGGLAECGKPALPVIREMIYDDSYDQTSAVSILAKIAGEDAGPEMTRILKKELVFWRKLGPSLQVGWWNGKGLQPDEMSLYRNCYCRLGACVASLHGLKYKPAADAVKDLRALWTSFPQLDDKSGLNAITEGCDRYLKAIEQ